MIEPNTTIAAGRDAWQRLRERERATWSDWLIVGRALIIGRTEALKIAKTNCPVGSRYNSAMGRWLHRYCTGVRVDW
jgi:hypothetical protein